MYTGSEFWNPSQVFGIQHAVQNPANPRVPSCSCLDLSLCLRECPQYVTVDTLAEGMPAFALERPEFAISSIEIVTSMSEASRGKSVDAAQVRMWVRDEVIDVVHSEELLRLCPPELRQEPYFVPMAGHNDLVEQDAEEFFRVAAQFVRSLEAAERV